MMNRRCPPGKVRVYTIDPLSDPRWEHFVTWHQKASVFHTVGWLKALHQTYGCEPVTLTTAAPGEPLLDGLLFCRVRSWLTGNRSVSLPFSDHCEPLVETVEELEPLLTGMRRDRLETNAKYCEIRPITPLEHEGLDWAQSAGYCMHQLDLRPRLQEIYQGFHKNCIQRKIRRAGQESLTYERGNSAKLLEMFYDLLVLTRRRQQLPPQPFSWFRNLIACMGDQLTIRLVSKSNRPVASILTLRHRDVLVYKYGCSDKTWSNLGGTPFLFWKAIEEAKAEGLSSLDLGRSDWDNPGLIEFKDRLGGRRSGLVYWRDRGVPARNWAHSWQVHLAKALLGHSPASLLPSIGGLIYPHLHMSASRVGLASQLP